MNRLFCGGATDPNAKVGVAGEADAWPNTGVGEDDGTGSSAMLSSAFILSLFPGEAAKPPPTGDLPSTGGDGEADALVNEKIRPDEVPLDELKAMGGAAFAEAENKNPEDWGEAEGGEPNNGEFLLCQPEPKTLEAILVELVVLIASEETVVPPKPNTGGAVALFEQTVVVEEDEPKLNGLEVALALELTVDPSETAAEVAPNLNKLGVGPTSGTREVVFDVEVDELKPILMLGVGTEPR